MTTAKALSVKSEARLAGGKANSGKVGDEVTRLILSFKRPNHQKIRASLPRLLPFIVHELALGGRAVWCSTAGRWTLPRCGVRSMARRVPVKFTDCALRVIIKLRPTSVAREPRALAEVPLPNTVAAGILPAVSGGILPPVPKPNERL